MNMKMKLTLTFISLMAFANGCSQPETSEFNATDAGKTPPQPSGTQYIAATEPDGAEPVGEARKRVQDGAAVTLVGHIGGSAEPFVNNLAAFTIVDPSVPYCQPDEGCPTPWDYCCSQNEVKDNIATVKIVDDQGKTIGEDARQLLAVKELSLVVVTGEAKRDDAGNLTVLASKIFVRPSK